MTEAELYEFDLNGYIVYRNVIEPDPVARMNRVLDDGMGGEFPHSFSFLDRDACFMDLMAHPRTLQIIRVMIGDWLRLDHAYGLQMTRETEFAKTCTEARGTTRESTSTSGWEAGCTTA